jgi:hypothetical protein
VNNGEEAVFGYTSYLSSFWTWGEERKIDEAERANETWRWMEGEENIKDEDEGWVGEPLSHCVGPSAESRSRVQWLSLSLTNTGVKKVVVVVVVVVVVGHAGGRLGRAACIAVQCSASRAESVKQNPSRAGKQR